MEALLTDVIKFQSNFNGNLYRRGEHNLKILNPPASLCYGTNSIENEILP